MMVMMVMITEKICSKVDRTTNSSQTTAQFIYFYTYYEKSWEKNVMYFIGTKNYH